MKTKTTVKLLALLFVLMLVFVAGCGNGSSGSADQNQNPSTEEKKVTLNIGGIQSAEDTSTLAMQKMAELAKEKSGGTIEITVFPASQLGDAVSQIEAVMMGSQDMFLDASSFLSQFVKDKQADSLFFAFESEEHFKKYLESDVAKGVEDQLLKERGARVIAQNWVRAPRVMVAKKPILSLADMKGLKMRVPEITTYLESVNALGAKPTQVPWGEVYLALTQGVVDAAEGPFDAVYSMKFHEGAPHISMTNHIRDNLAIVMNEQKFQSLSDKQKAALIEAAKEAGDWYTETVKAKLNEVAEKLKAEGATLHEIDTTEFKEVMTQAATSLEDKGLWRKGLFEEIQKLK